MAFRNRLMSYIRRIHVLGPLLKKVADGEPDELLSPDVATAVLEMRALGWLRVIEHSDGNYVLLTANGRKVVEYLR